MRIEAGLIRHALWAWLIVSGTAVAADPLPSDAVPAPEQGETASGTRQSEQEAPGAVATDAPPEMTRPAALEEIVVTARRREEKAQDVPASIAAFSVDDLEQQDIRTVTDLERAVTGLNVCCSRGMANFMWLRGIPGVVGYFSEVPVMLNGSALFFDIEGASVLKGPQGTLFGLSTNGGAILYAPTRPTETAGGYVQSTLGNYGRQTTEGVFNTPMLDGKLLLRGGVQVSRAEGYVRDLTQNEDLGDENYWVGRISAVMRPSERLENHLVFNYYTSHNNGTASVVTDVNPNGSINAIYGPGTVEAILERQRELGLFRVETTDIEGGSRTESEQINVVDTLTWDLTDRLTLKNIYGYQRVEEFSHVDADGTPLMIEEFGAPPGAPNGPTQQHTEELQLQGRAAGDALQYTLGAFMSWSDQDPQTIYYSIFGSLYGSRSQLNADTRAVFAHAIYDASSIVDGLSLTGGVRYSWDERRLRSATLDGAGTVLSEFEGREEWKAPSYTLSLQYRAVPGTMLYLSNSKGYSSGGFNTGAYVPESFKTFEPESLNNFELGVKSDWMLGTVQGRTNVAAFYGIYEDIQTYLIVPPSDDAPPGTVALAQLNAAKGHIHGFDLEQAFVLFEDLQITATATLLRAGYDDYVSPDGTDFSRREFVFLPDWKYGLGATYRVPWDAGYGRFSVSADYTRTDKVNGNANKDVPIPQDYQLGFDNLNVSLTWNDVGGNPDLNGTLFVTNVTENRYTAGGGVGYDTIGLKRLQVAAPRMWGVRLRYAFGG